MRGGPISYLELLHRLEETEAWLNGLGFRKHDRLRQAIAAVRRLTDLREKVIKQEASDSEVLHTFANYVSAMSEVAELAQIYEAFNRERPETLKPKLSRAVLGPSSIGKETIEKADSRNVIFELALAAEWRDFGLDVVIGEPDITLWIRGVRYFVECKRPFREESIRANVRSANRQLTEILEKPGHESSFGVIALSASRCLSPDPAGALTFETLKDDPDVEDGKTWNCSFARSLKELLDRNQRQWLRQEFHPRVVAMVFHAGPPYIETNTVSTGKMSVSLVSPIGKEGLAFTRLSEALMDAYQMEVREVR